MIRCSHRPKEEVLRTLPGSPAPREISSFSRPAVRAGAFWRGWLTGWNAPVLIHSSNRDPLGNCVRAPVETAATHSLRLPRFLIAAGGAVPCSCITGLARPAPEELVKYATPSITRRRGIRKPAWRILSPVIPGLSQKRRSRFFHFGERFLFFQ